MDELKMPFGKFKGQTIDLKTRRSVHIIHVSESHYTLDYFFHGGKFYRAKIPRNAVEKIVGQRFNFSMTSDQEVETSGGNPFVNHAQVRLILSQPIQLFPLAQETSGSPLEEVDDFIYSVEVVGPKGVAWNLRLAFGNFVAAHRILSTEEVVFERTVLNQYVVVQSPPIKFDQEQKNRALDLIVERSHEAGMNQPYYLITPFFGANNCTSEPFDMLDELLAKQYSKRQRLAAKMLWRLPIALRSYLKLRGAIDSTVEMPTLNEEFRDLRTAPQMTERAAKIRK